MTKSIEYIAWTEPEKIDFLRFVPELLDIGSKERADLIVPYRTPSSFSSYPNAQQYSEKFGNCMYTNYGYLDSHGNSIDTFFGPKIWRTKASCFFLAFESPIVADELAKMRIEEREQKADRFVILKEREKSQIDLNRTDHMMHMPTCLMILEKQRVISIPIDYKHPSIQTIEERMIGYNKKRLWQLNALDEQFRLVRRLHERGLLSKKIKELKYFNCINPPVK